MRKKRFAIVSYNMYCNFTNYGSALQTYALHNAINHIAPDRIESIVLDYCPDILRNKDVLNPIDNMWDQNDEARKMCELSLPAIRVNNEKFTRFYNEQYKLSNQKYTSENYDDSFIKEGLDGYICGSDTIFCIDEFGFDDGYYANYSCMKNSHSISYAASFGDSHFNEETYIMLNERLQNFKAISLREDDMISYVQEHTNVLVSKVLDPTLLLTAKDYAPIVANKQSNEKYLLLYVRRYNPTMQVFAEKMAAKKGWKIIEISLRAINAERHRMFYDAGIEEFLSLVKGAEYIVTNSFHGMIFAVQFCRPFYIFSREQCNTKISELLDLFDITGRLCVTGSEKDADPIDYDAVHVNIERARVKSFDFLKKSLLF